MKMMNTKGNPKIHTLLLLVTVFLFGTRQAIADNVYLSLYLGNITFNNSNQLAKGAYKWNGTSFVATTAVEDLSASNTYVIGMWDTNENPTATQFKPVTTICGGSVVIVGNPDDSNATNARAEGVPTLNEWDVEAPIAASGYTTRRSTTNKITINIKDFDLDIRLDNVWSTASSGTASSDGSLLFKPNTGDTNTAKLYVDLVGDNRLSAFRITNYESTNTEAHIGITKAGVRSNGTLTVGIYTTGSTQTHNHYRCAIGSLQTNSCYGLFIDGGTIYAGSAKADHCTAIGAGGNAHATVTITGGTVTAVTSSSGTAIGGGRGLTLKGGNGDVTISGGTVYAYNHGDYQYDSGDNPTYYYYLGCAIGGGSSRTAGRGTATVNISGGTVYAQALGAPVGSHLWSTGRLPYYA